MFKQGGGEELAMKEGVPFLGKIPMDGDIASSGDSGGGCGRTGERQPGREVGLRPAGRDLQDA